MSEKSAELLAIVHQALSLTISMHSRIWVTCIGCGSAGDQTFFGSEPIGSGLTCPSCGSSWSENEIIASSAGKSISVLMGNISSDLKKGLLKIIWLVPQKGIS